MNQVSDDPENEDEPADLSAQMMDQAQSAGSGTIVA